MQLITQACATTTQDNNAAKHKPRATQNTIHVDRRHKTEHGAQVSEPQPKTETQQDMSARIRTPRFKMKQGNRTRRREHTQSRTLT